MCHAMPNYVYVASGTRDILVFWAAWPRLWATPYTHLHAVSGVSSCLQRSQVGSNLVSGSWKPNPQGRRDRRDRASQPNSEALKSTDAISSFEETLPLSQHTITCAKRT